METGRKIQCQHLPHQVMCTLASYNGLYHSSYHLPRSVLPLQDCLSLIFLVVLEILLDGEMKFTNLLSFYQRISLSCMKLLLYVGENDLVYSSKP